MSFFDNTKNAGWALTIIGILMIISALVGFYTAFTADGGIGENVGLVVIAIGALIAAVIYFLYGNKVRTGAISTKIDVLGNYVRIVGVTTIIVALFTAIGSFLTEYSFWDQIVMIILGLIVIWASTKIMDGQKTTIDKVLWIVLLIVFVILFIVNFIGIFTNGFDVVTIIRSVCYAVVYLLMAGFLLDSDVKKKMGM